MATTHLTFANERARGPMTHSGLRRVFAGLAPLLALYAVYTLGRWLVAGRGPLTGRLNAEWIIDLERALLLDWELGVQEATLPHLWLIHAANRYYVYGFLPVLILCAVLGAWRAQVAFAWWRTSFAISLAIAFVGYLLFPLTPPRLLPDTHGFVDTLMVYGPRYYGDATGNSIFNAYGSMPTLVNVHAAMPSMHIAWSIMAVAIFSAAFGYRRWTFPIAILHPTLMAITVIVTGNHFILDIVAGIAALLAAIGLTIVRHGRLTRAIGDRRQSTG